MADPLPMPAAPPPAGARPRDWVLVALVVCQVVLLAITAHLASAYRVSLWIPISTAFLLAVLRNPAVPAIAPVLCGAAAIAAALGAAGLWPCDLRCQGAGTWQRLAGIPVLAPAAALYAAIAVGLSLGDRRPRLFRAAGVALWAAAGASAYYTWLATRLKLDCALCISLHAAVFTAVAGRPLGAPSLPVKALAAAVAAGLLAGAYALRAPPPAQPPPPTTAPAAAEQAAMERADRGRRRGRADAPLVAELSIDFQCPECARAHGDLAASLAPALAAGRVELIIRHLVRERESSSRQLAQWAFAAAAAGSHEIYLAGMLGSHETATIAELRRRLDELLDGAAIERAAQADAAAIARLVDDDQRRLRALEADTRTPALVLSERATGSVRQRWQGRFAATAVAAALE